MNRQMNLGCGIIQPDGWVNVDKDTEVHPPYRMDARYDSAWRNHFKSDSFDMVFMNHSLQQFIVRDIPPLLENVKRVLVVGGRLRVVVPDIIGAFHAYERGDMGWFPNAGDSVSLKLAQYLTWYSSARTTFTKAFLLSLLSDAGFDADIATPGDCELDDRIEESIFVEGVKP